MTIVYLHVLLDILDKGRRLQEPNSDDLCRRGLDRLCILKGLYGTFDYVHYLDTASSHSRSLCQLF
jgi:hypothetical protein